MTFLFFHFYSFGFSSSELELFYRGRDLEDLSGFRTSSVSGRHFSLDNFSFFGLEFFCGLADSARRRVRSTHCQNGAALVLFFAGTGLKIFVSFDLRDPKKLLVDEWKVLFGG